MYDPIAKTFPFYGWMYPFIETILEHSHNGYIHCDFNPLRSDDGGTVTGRFSSSNPNLQQIPAKGDIGKRMREVFIPEIGHEWGSFDYSQQEPRIVVHFAIKHKCKKTSELKKQYDRGEADFHQIVAQMANISRTQAKTINLGLFYGMGKNKLQNELGLKPEQASELFESYHKKVPFVKEISEKFMQFANNEKLIYTLEDRF